MRRFLFALALFCAISCSGGKSSVPVSDDSWSSSLSMTVDRIWGERYSAFPSIVEYRGAYYVSFREAESHIFDSKGIAEGKTRILRSEDGVSWESVALMGIPELDLRDPKLSVTADGRLMVMMGGSRYVEKKLMGCVPHVSFSIDGKKFSEPEPVIYDDASDYEWFWRVTWHDGAGYTVTYGKGGESNFALLKTADGIRYEKITDIDVPGFPNETTIRFLPDGRMAMLIRRDPREGDPEETACWGFSSYPFTDWSVKELGFRIGGPEFIVLDDGSIVAGGRSYVNGDQRTFLWKGTAEGEFTPFAVLPSKGDNSYPGFLVAGDELWTVYYSSHESPAQGRARARIYLSRMSLDYVKSYPL